MNKRIPLAIIFSTIIFGLVSCNTSSNLDERVSSSLSDSSEINKYTEGSEVTTTVQTTTESSAPSTTVTTTSIESKPETTQTEGHRYYILNHNSGKIHNVDCRTLEEESDAYELIMDIGMNWVNESGYSPCEVCNPYIPETSDKKPVLSTTAKKEFDKSYYSFSENMDIILKYDTKLYDAPDKESEALYDFQKDTILVAVGETSDWYAVIMNDQVVFCEKVSSKPHYDIPIYTDSYDVATYTEPYYETPTITMAPDYY